jgi:hypothetical protein
MRHAMGIISLLLAVGGRPILATPTYYTIDFSISNSSPLPVSGSFYYDSSTPVFTDFTVLWDGTTFDLTSSANGPQLSGTACTGGQTGAAATFVLLTACPGADWVAYNNEPANPGYDGFEFINPGTTTIYIFDSVPGSGAYTEPFGTFQSQAVPEPGATSLITIGLACLLRKRIARGARRPR